MTRSAANRIPIPRRSIRVPTSTQIELRRSGEIPYVVRLLDLSDHGCSLEVVNRVLLDEILWVKLPGIQALQGFVCWEKEFTCGIEFKFPLHSAVMDMLAKRFARPDR